MKKLIPYFVIALLLILLAHRKTQDNSQHEVVIHDTVYSETVVERVDTIFRPQAIKKTEVVVDTIFINKGSQNEAKVPRTQCYYNSSYYEAWVSGYKPSLDSINVFQKTVTKEVVKESRKYVYIDKNEYYLNAGCNFVKGNAAPFVGATVKFKKGFTLGADVGYYEKSAFFGVNLGIKLNR